MNNYKDLNDYEIMYLVKENDETANDLIFDKYKPIVYKLAKDYTKKGKTLGLEFEDFVQEGYIGLFNAIKNYTDDKDTLFYTYATISIKSKMQNVLTKNSTLKNMALNNSISLYEPVCSDSDNILLDFIVDNKAIKPDLEFENKLVEDNFRKILLDLPIIKSSILELKWNGFNNRSISRLLEIEEKKLYNMLSSLRKKIADIR